MYYTPTMSRAWRAPRLSGFMWYADDNSNGVVVLSLSNALLRLLSVLLHDGIVQLKIPNTMFSVPQTQCHGLAYSSALRPANATRDWRWSQLTTYLDSISSAPVLTHPYRGVVVTFCVLSVLENHGLKTKLGPMQAVPALNLSLARCGQVC